LIAGFWIWKVSSMAEAIEWVKRCPNPMNEESDIDIRPIFEAEDFGEAFTPELREMEARIRAQALGLSAPRFENGHEMVIAGLNEHYTHETRINIPKQWQRFVPHLGKIPGAVGNSSYGVVWRTKPDFSFDYLCGVEMQSTDKLPAGFTQVTIAAQRYAVFDHRENVSTIGKTIDTIWTKWVTDCGLKIAQTPCFERYTEEFNPQTGMGGIEIWVPIAS
jgi:predicted transcriptional regulator YdeE